MQSVSWRLDLLYSIKERVGTLKLKCITVGSLCNTSLGFRCAEGFQKALPFDQYWGIYLVRKHLLSFTLFSFYQGEGTSQNRSEMCRNFDTLIFKKLMFWTLIFFFFSLPLLSFFFPWALKAWENKSKPMKDSIHIYRSLGVDQLIHCSFLSVPYFLT